jgi:hypothetical protein
MKFLIRGGRKEVISDMTAPGVTNPRTEEALLKALAKAFRWRKCIEQGEYASITELAEANGVNDSYACRLLRLTLLAPKIVTAILDRQQGSDLTLKQIARPLPLGWDRQAEALQWESKR